MRILNDVKTILGIKQKSIQSPSTTHPKKLLIVEDEPILREMYQDKFSHEGYTVITAENGRVGLEKLVEYKPDIILLDLMMPVMDGEAMLRRLRELPEYKSIPVLVLTNAGEVENIRHTKLYYDAIEFIIKSNVTLEEIVAKIKRLIV